MSFSKSKCLLWDLALVLFSLGSEVLWHWSAVGTGQHTRNSLGLARQQHHVFGELVQGVFRADSSLDMYS